MNRSAAYEPGLGGIVARSVTGYQKREQWAAISRLKDCTFLLHDTPPAAWEASLAAFEGEGGLHDPDGIRAGTLGKGDALYETPAAVLQYRLSLGPGERRRYRFMFGPARDDEAIAALRARYLCEGGFETARAAYRHYLAEAAGCLEIDTPDPDFNAFANHWLGRQVFYHGSNHRLATDPQTRNFLQDAMGAVYVRPALFRTAILTTLAQQEEDGALPDGIRLFEGAELKYINQVPHSDHAAWLPVCLEAYLDETDDYDLLDEPVTDARGRSESVFERIGRAMEHLRGQLDGRGLSLIAQGDWCDPMNGVGPEGRGVSGWLSIATIHAFRLWAVVCRRNRRFAAK